MSRRVIGPFDVEFPAALKEIPDSPRSLFLRGRPLQPAPSVAIVGTRRASAYGLEVAEWLGKQLGSAGVTIVSGLAWGIDAAAHKGALASGGNTVAVLGNGLDVCFPRRNRWLYEQIGARGTLVTEYADGMQAYPGNFPARNRIIAGMCSAAVIVEAKTNGGAMITARLAMEFGREVFAVPGPVHSPVSRGCHALLRDGARLIASSQDVLDDLGWLNLVSPGEEPVLDPDEARILQALEAKAALLDQIASRARMPVSTASAVLVRLEMKGIATRHPGGRFALAVA